MGDDIEEFEGLPPPRLPPVQDAGDTPLPNGCTLYWQTDPAVGCRVYTSDEIGGGVEVWNTALVDHSTLLAALVCEERLSKLEYVHEQRARDEGRSSPQRERDDKRLADYITAFQSLRDMPAQQLVNLALSNSPLPVGSPYEQILEELCSRAYPNWPNEGPAVTESDKRFESLLRAAAKQHPEDSDALVAKARAQLAAGRKP